MERGEQQGRPYHEMQSLSVALACLFVVYVLMAKLPRGLLRFFCVLPCLPIFAMVPFSTRSHSVRAVLSFMFLWVCPSKLFLRCWDIAPDYPGNGFIYFVVTSVMPLRIKGRTHPLDKDRKPTSAHTHQGALFLPLLYMLCFYATMNIFWYFSSTSSWFTNVLYCLFVYLGLEGVLGLLSTLTSLLLRVELHPFFDKPFLASSLSEFWGRRWNRLASYMLRETVYVPILHFLSADRGKHMAGMHVSPLIMSNGSSQDHIVVQSEDVGRLFSLRSNSGADASKGMQEKAKTNFAASGKELNARKVPLSARVIAMLASFIASGLMHELIFFCINQTPATWEVTMFFILHGIISIVEVFLRRKFPDRRKLPRPVAIMCTIAFLYFSAAWLFMPPVTRTGADMQILAEYRHMQIAIANLFSRQ